MGRTTSKLAWVGVALVWLFKLAAIVLLVVLPLVAVWVASSLAAYTNHSKAWSIAAGVALFPVVPIAWELIGAWRRSRREKPRPPILKPADRIVLRTMFLSTVFIVALLGTRPEVGFAALTTRGDWMLEGMDAPWAVRVRGALHDSADALEWMYDAAHTNEYEELVAESQTRAPVDPRPTPTPTPTPTATPEPTSAPTAPRATPVDFSNARLAWPSAAIAHPLTRRVPAAVAHDIAGIARFVRDNEPNPAQRARLIHDIVADRIAYDVVSYRAHQYPSQDAADVLRSGKGVCAGYANLFTALGEAAGLDVVTVLGDARAADADLSGEGHAWNAVRLGGGWQLVDVTWDAGGVDESGFHERLGTGYLGTPPHVFGVTHFPDEPEWQLLPRPLSRGDFIRQPVTQPAFHAFGMSLVWPNRSQVDTRGDLWVTIANPRNALVYGEIGKNRVSAGSCDVINGPRAKLHCVFPTAGAWEITLFASVRESGEFGDSEWVGSLAVHDRR